MKFWNAFRDMLGFRKNTAYEKNYLYETNIRTGIYMALVVISIEIWMMIRNLVKYPGGTFFDYFDNWNGFLTLFSAGVLALLLPLLYFYGKKKEQGKIGIVITCILLFINIWMMIRKGLALSAAGEAVGVADVIDAMKYYILLLLMEIMMLHFSVMYARGTRLSSGYGQWTMIVFTLICLGFGIETSMSDLSRDRQILCYLTMVLFVACLLIWKPYVSILMLAVVFYYFYAQWRGVVEDPEGRAFSGDTVNYVTFFIALTVVSISIFHQRQMEARKDESLEEANKHLEKLAIYDELTGLYNMNYFRSAAADFIRERGKAYYLYFDLINFKEYNEKYGFKKGNELLKDVGESIKALFPEGIVARASDDHFQVLTDLSEEKQLELIEGFKKELAEKHKSTKLGIKVGAYMSSNKEEDVSIACDHARYACGLIKKRFGQDYMAYDETVEKDFQQKQYIVNSIDEAVKNGYIKVFYQPVVWAKTQKLCGVEALARWIDPTYGFLSPGAFIPALEEYHQIHKIDMNIMEQVCRDIRKALDNGRTPVPVSINFSRLDFELMDVPAKLEEVVEKYQISKELLHVEITESALSGNLDNLKMKVHELKDKGYQLWLDDFGSAYSSLNVLKDYEFDTMKIDMLFMRDFSSEGKVTSILKSIVAMANVIGMNTLTEGVETKEAAEFLRDIGCDRLQGYYFSKPVPIEDLRAAIDDKKFEISDELKAAG